MTARGITFDFHNTIAACDAWFQLEIRQLVGAFLGWRATERGDPVSEPQIAAADAAYRQLRQEIHVHGNEQTAEQCIANVLGRLGIAATRDEIARGVEALMRDVSPAAAPLDGVIATIRDLAGRGIPLGIVSSAVYHPFLEWTLERFGIREAFAVVVTSASSRYYKSRPEIFWHALDALGVKPADAVHVGDSLRFDVGGAQRAGMRAILVSADSKPAQEGDPVPDAVLPHLIDAGPAIASVLMRA